VSSIWRSTVSGITFAAHELDRHPELQGIEAARAHLPVTEKVELDISAAAIFTQILRSHIERIAQHTPPPSRTSVAPHEKEQTSTCADRT
jgi:hypothetical protein